MAGKNGSAGFTLLELIVVIAILATLVTVLAVAGGKVKEQARVHATRMEIAAFALALDGYARDFGDYPPTSLRTWNFQSNGLCDGIEGLIACLATEEERGPYLPKDFDRGRLTNADKDPLAPPQNPDPWLGKRRAGPSDAGVGFPVKNAFEYADRWGRPYVYIHHRDYDAAWNCLADGRTLAVRAVKDAKTGEYFSPTSFQIRSLGPNGKDDAGVGDDICSWR